MKTISIYDTSLRDGLQGEKVNLNLEEKLQVVKALDQIGIHYIEGGFPLASEQEMEFFKRVRDIPLKAKICSFGSTKKPKISVEDDFYLKAFLQANTGVVTIVGKSHIGHVKEVLKTTLEENLNMIGDSVKYLKKNNKEVIYDAEHFFDGFMMNQDYALETIKTAQSAGADIIILCDTNGGVIHSDFIEALRVVNKIEGMVFGVHLHNDTGFGMANSIISLEYGSKQIQGTLNGWGERCGNVELSTIMANLHFKTSQNLFNEEQISKLTYTCRYLDKVANLITDERKPYVGKSAFAHKAGQHADVILKKANLMEHIDGNLVGNTRRILLSELAGKASIVFKMNKYGEFKKDSKKVVRLTQVLKEREQKGYEFEAAEGSFELIIRKELGIFKPMFELLEYRVEMSKVKKKLVSSNDDYDKNVWAFIKVKIDENIYMGDSYRTGPVAALDSAFRSAIYQKFNFINDIFLKDYKVRVLGNKDASASTVRVLVETASKNEKYEKSWGTIGVSDNIIEASWEALKDSFDYAYNEIFYN